MNPNPIAAIPEYDVAQASSERQAVGWDLKNAFRNYSTLVVAQIAVAFFSFASVKLVTWSIGFEGYGGVIAVIAASQVAQMFVNWTGIALARYGVEEFVETGRITKSFWARTAVFVPNTVVMLMTGVLWLPLLSDGLKLPPNAIWYVAAHFTVSAVWFHIQQAMQAAKLPRLQGVMLAVERVLIFLGLAALIAAGRLDGLTAIAVYTASPALMAVAGLIAIRRLFSWRLTLSTDSIRKLVGFSLPLIPYSLIGYFSTSSLDAFFIQQYLTSADLGIYSLAYQMSGILLQFPLLASSLLLPLFVTLRSSGKSDRVASYMQDLLPLLTFVGGLGCVGAAMASRVVIPFVFETQAEPSVLVFWILISSSALAIPTVIGFAPYTNAISATYVATAMAAVSSVVNLAGNYLLIPRYGLQGCAWATVLAYGASLLVVIVIGRWRFSIRHRWTIPALAPVLTASIYASATGDLNMAFLLAFVVAFVIVLVWRRAVKDGLKIFKDYRSFVAG